MAELSSSRRLASVVEVLSSLDKLSILFRITSNMSLIFLSTPRDSTPPSTEWKDRRETGNEWKLDSEYIRSLQNSTHINHPASSSSASPYCSWFWLCSCFAQLSRCTWLQWRSKEKFLLLSGKQCKRPQTDLWEGFPLNVCIVCWSSATSKHLTSLNITFSLQGCQENYLYSNEFCLEGRL